MQGKLFGDHGFFAPHILIASYYTELLKVAQTFSAKRLYLL